MKRRHASLRAVRIAAALVGLVLLAGGYKLAGGSRTIRRIVAHERVRFKMRARAAHPVGGGAAAGDSAWTLSVGEAGTAGVRYRNVEVGNFHYVYWGKSWSWAAPEAKQLPRGAAGGKNAFSVQVPALGVRIEGAVQKADGALSFDYTVENSTAVDSDVRGGIEFNLKLDASVLEGQDPDVTLRPEQRGFDLSRSGGAGFSVQFNPPMASVHFELGRRGQIRCYFDEGRLAAGKRHWTMTIRLPHGGTVQPSIAERYGYEPTSSWTPDTLVWDKWPIDVGFLNDGDRPAGTHGRLTARGDRLVFEDGTVARFWGTNLTAYTLFTGSKTEVANQAKRIAALGYNLVRIHHHDSDWVSPNVFAAGETTQTLNDAALDAIDWWVKCLRDQGVYVWMDLKVGRKFRAGDGVTGFAELTKSEPSGRGFDYVDPRLQTLEQTFARQYLARRNRYTGRSYLDDPAIVAALVTNEDDLNRHFGSLMLPDQGNPIHAGMLRSAIETSAGTLGVSVGDASRLWEPGPAKLVLADIEARFFQRAKAQLNEIGFKGLMVGTSYWGEEALYSLASLAAGDIIDVHSYGDPESLSADPRFEANFVSWIGAAQLVGKPLSVSEWNVESPKRDRFVAPLYVAAIGDLQGWDAPMIFAYSQGGNEAPSAADTWSTSYDPAITALMPAAAVMFRQQHVKQAHKTFCFRPTQDLFYGTDITPASSVALRTILDQSRLVVALPNLPQVAWDDSATGPAADATIVTDPDQDFLAPDATKVRSDTGELERDWGAGVETINTPMSQAAVGWIGGRTISLRDVELRIETPKAAVALTSLDGQPIASSKKILLTVVGQVVASPGDKLPYLAQPVQGSIVLRASRAARVMIPLSPRALPGPAATGSVAQPGFEPIPARPDRVGQLFTLPRKLATHWWLLEPAPPGTPTRHRSPASKDRTP